MIEQILVVEDEDALRTDLVEFLTAKGYAASGTATVAETLACLRTTVFDAVILDIGLPDGDGLQILTHIRQRDLPCQVVILTADGEPDARVKGLEEGADAYLVKRATLREIEATLRSVLRRHLPMSPTAHNSPRWTFDRTGWRLVAPNGLAVRLSGSEVALLSALADSWGTACPRERIAFAIENIGSHAESLRNLDALVRRLRRKTTSATGLEMPIRMVYGTGYMLTAELSPA